MIVTEIGRIEPGQAYRYHELRAVSRDGSKVVEEALGGCYRVEGFARDGRTQQEVVVYRGLDGADRERLFVCSLYDFALRFRPEATASAAGTDTAAAASGP